MSLLISSLISGAALAQTDDASGTFTFYRIAQPQGPVTAAYLRMHHPLFLLDLCRQVKAGTLDRQKVEGSVGRSALDALLSMDLDALFQKLTAQPDPAAPPSGQSLWYRILTDGETAPLPPLDAPEPLLFQDVHAADSPSRILRVTSPVDGVLQTALPSDSPFQILSMRTYDGVILEPSPLPKRHGPEIDAASVTKRRGGPETHLAPELARTQPPWVLPVAAGQDIDVEVGLPVGSALPPGGISSAIAISVGGSFQGGLWQVATPIQAHPALQGDIYITVFAPQVSFDVVSEPSYNPNVPRTFNVTLEMSNPVPAVKVKGTVQPLSLPQGVSMQSSNFTLQPQGFVSLSLTLSIDRQSQAWFTENVAQPFSLQVNYQTVGPPFALGKATVQLFFTVYPSSQSWYDQAAVAKGFLGSGGVKCEQNLILFSDGTLVRSGDCDNGNAFNAKIVSNGTLAGNQVVSDVYFMGWFSQDFKSSTVSWPYGQTNYVFLISQPLVMWWTKQ